MNYPLFGEILESYIPYREKLRNPFITIFCGTNARQKCIKHFSIGSLVTCLEEGMKHEDIAWPVNGFHVLLVDLGGQSHLGLKKFAYHLLKSGAKAVTLDTDLAPLQTYKL